MQFDTQRVFPYPVLRPDIDDYIDSEFQATIDLLGNESNIRAECTYQLSADEILQEIKKEKAKFVTVLACRDTYRREVCATTNTSDKFEFPAGVFRGEVLVSSYVVAESDISGFTSDNINNEFGEGPFNFVSGSVLAIDEPKVVYVERENFRPISSVFELVQKEGIAYSDWQINFDSPKIQIAVNPSAKSKIDSARNDKNNQVILLNSVYFAAIMQTIRVLKESDDYNDYRWAVVFYQKLQNMGLNLDSIEEYKMAQLLLHSPLSLLQEYIFKGDG